MAALQEQNGQMCGGEEPAEKKPRVDTTQESPDDEYDRTSFEEDLAFYQALEEDEMEVGSSQERRWSRPDPPPIDLVTTPIIFQQLEIDHYVSSPLPGMPGAQTGSVPIIRMFGVSNEYDYTASLLFIHVLEHMLSTLKHPPPPLPPPPLSPPPLPPLSPPPTSLPPPLPPPPLSHQVTKEGHSVCAHVHGFTPYLYVPAPSESFSAEHCSSFKEALRLAILDDSRGRDSGEPVLAVDIVRKCSMYGYNDRDFPFLKVTLALPKLVAPAKRLLERGIPIRGLGSRMFQVFESNIDFEIRFMIDNDVVGCNWVECPPGKYRLRKPHPVTRSSTTPTSNGGFSMYGQTSSSSSSTPLPQTKCQIELDISFEDFISHPADGEWQNIAPCRILSFDIECAARKGVFPEAEHDSVIQIANMVLLQGEKDPFIRNVFTLKQCASIVGSDVRCFESEKEMLEVTKHTHTHIHTHTHTHTHTHHYCLHCMCFI